MRYLILLIIVTFFLSCEKDISVDIPEPETKIVVEGFIEQGLPPAIFLSKNAPYFASVDPVELNKYNIRGAKVSIKEGNNEYTLTEVAGPGKLSFYTNFLLVGKIGATYTLTVVAEGTTIEAYTGIPKPIPLDSVKFELAKHSDSLGILKCHLTDPDTIGNYYRFFTRRKGKDSLFYTTPFSSVFHDQIVNGKAFDFELERGIPTNSEKEEDHGEERGFFKKGDTIYLRWCTLEKEHYNFWRTMERSNNSNGNPFAAPVSIRSNINGGLGIWGGYGASYDTIIAK